MKCESCGAPSRGPTCAYCGGERGGVTSVLAGAVCRHHPDRVAEHSCAACRARLCDDCAELTTTPHFQRAFIFRRFSGSWAYCRPRCSAHAAQLAEYERARQLHLKLLVVYGVVAAVLLLATFATAFWGLLLVR